MFKYLALPSCLSLEELQATGRGLGTRLQKYVSHHQLLHVSQTLHVFITCLLVFCSGGGGDLSVLARGRGLVGGGVEIECFADDRKAFTLTVSEQLALVGGRNFDF